MKEFDPQYIEGTREFFHSEGFGVEQANVGELSFHYFVIPQDKNPGLPDFALRMTRTDSASGEVSGIYGVSDSVPQDLRPYWAAHEYVEFTKIGISEEGRCKKAEEIVVGLIPQGLRTIYVGRRIDFFANLAEYFRKDIDTGSENYVEEDVKEVNGTLAYLKELLA